MDNEVKTPNVVRAVISDGELAALLGAAGIKPEKTSPLAPVSGTEAMAGGKLPQSGLVDSSNRPTADCLESLRILANPATEIDLFWGNPQGVSLSKAYAPAGKDKLVSFTRMNGSNHISFFLSAQDIPELIAPKMAFPEIKEPAVVAWETDTAAAPLFFALLDLYREGQLKAALERQLEFEVRIEPEAVNRVLQEAKLEQNLTWYAPVSYMAAPNDFPLTESIIRDGISDLKRQGIVDADGVLNPGMMAFAFRAFPLAAFCGIKIYTAKGGGVEKAQMALFRGFSTLLFTQLSSENGANRALINSISTSQLPEILFSLATRPFEVVAAPVPPQPATADSVNCGKCGTPNSPGAKFCNKCGGTLAAAPKAKFCVKCGNPLKADEKFCNKCGTKTA